MSLNLRALGQRDPTKYVEWLSWQALLEINNRRGKKKEWNCCAWNYPIRMYCSEVYVSQREAILLNSLLVADGFNGQWRTKQSRLLDSDQGLKILV